MCSPPAWRWQPSWAFGAVLACLICVSGSEEGVYCSGKHCATHLPSPTAASSSASASPATAHDAPVPPRQSAGQLALYSRIANEAAHDSPNATASILSYFNTPSFRNELRQCCSGMASLPAATLLSMFRAEVMAAEVVHNFDPRGNCTFCELNLTQWSEAKYDYNLWTMVRYNTTNKLPKTCAKILLGCPHSPLVAHTHMHKRAQCCQYLC